MAFVELSKDQGWASVKLNRPAAKNALNLQMLEELRDVALQLASDTTIAAVVVHSDGPFSAGVDRAEAKFYRTGEHAPSLLELREFIGIGKALCTAWESLEAYTVAAIEGYCIGGAAAFVSALDYRICGESAFFMLPEVSLGINVGWGSLPRLVAQMGPARAKHYMMFGKRLDAATAVSWGACEEVVADGGSLARATRLARDAAALPPLPMRMTKQSVNAVAYALAGALSHMDRDQYLLALQAQASVQELHSGD